MNYFVDYSGDNAWGKPVPTYRQEALRTLVLNECKDLSSMEQDYLIQLIIKAVKGDCLASEERPILAIVDRTFMYRLLAVAMTDPEPTPVQPEESPYKYGVCEDCGAVDMYLTAYGHQRDGLLYLCVGCFVNAELDHKRMPELKDLQEYFPHQGMPMPTDTTMHPEKFLEVYGLETAQTLIKWHDRVTSKMLDGTVVNYAGINIDIEELRPAVKEKEIILGIPPDKGTRQHFEFMYEPDANASPFTQVRFNEVTDLYEPLTSGSGEWVVKSLNAAWLGYKLHRDSK